MNKREGWIRRMRRNSVSLSGVRCGYGCNDPEMHARTLALSLKGDARPTEMSGAKEVGLDVLRDIPSPSSCATVTTKRCSP